MSAIVQRLQLIWTSNSAQARGDIGLASGQVLQLGRNVQQSGRQAGIASQQMRAFGTTLRYMVAGSVIYGIGSMVRNLAQLQQSMGLISAIGTTAGFTNLSRTGGGIQQLTVDMLNMSTRTVQPMDEVSAAMENLVSSVQATQGIGSKDLVPALEIISRTAKLSVTPVQDMTKGITAMNQAFVRPQSLTNIRHLAAQWYEMISLVPGGKAAAPQLVGQLGNMAASARMANVSPGELFAMTSASLRFGIPAAQTGAGIAYLLRSIAQPEAPGTVKSARQLFSSLGITNDFVQQQGGRRSLIKIFEAADKSGIHGNFKKAIQRGFATRDDPNFDPDSTSGLGLSGSGINLLGGIFRRQHALRTAIAIYSMWKTGTFDSDLAAVGDSQKAYQKSLHDFSEGWKNFLAQVPLSTAANALQNLKTEMVMGFGPFLKYPAKLITGISGFAGRHPDATRYTAQAGAGLIAALGLGAGLSKLGVPGLGKFGKLFGKVSGGAGQTLVTTQAIQDTMKALEDPNAPLGSSPTKPIYVYVVGQAPWVGSGGGGGGSGPGGPGIPPSIVTGAKAAGRFGKVLKVVGGVAAITVVGDALFNELVNQAGGKWSGSQVNQVLGAGRQISSFSGNRRLIAANDPNHRFFFAQSPQTHGQFQLLTRQQYQELLKEWTAAAGKKDIRDFKRGDAPFGKAWKSIETVFDVKNRPNIHNLPNQKITGDIWLKIDLTDEKGKVTHARVHLPPDTFVGGNHPGTRGRTKPMKIVGAMKNV